MHHTAGASVLGLAVAQFLQHGLCGIPAMDDYGQIQLPSQI
jgi:hypothetical protein